MGTLSLRVAPNGVADQLVVNGVARLAGTMQTVFQPGTGFSRSYNLVTATGGLHRHVQHAVDAEPAGFPERQPGLRQHQRDAQPAIGAGLDVRAGRQSVGRRPGAGRRLQQRQRPQCGAGPVRPLSRPDRLRADGAVGRRSPASASPTPSPAASLPSLLANRAVTRRAQPNGDIFGDGGARRLRCRGRGVRSRRPPTGAATGAAPSAARSGSMPTRHGRAGGAAVDRRRRFRRRLSRRAADGAGRGAGLERQQLFGGGDRRQRPRHGFHAGLYGMHDWNGFYANGALAYSRFDGNTTRPIAGIGTTETAKSPAIASQFAARLEVGRPSSSATSRRRGSPSRRSRPSSRCSCGRRPSPNRA